MGEWQCKQRRAWMKRYHLVSFRQATYNEKQFSRESRYPMKILTNHMGYSADGPKKL